MSALILKLKKHSKLYSSRRGQMSVDNAEQIAQAYSWLRAMSGGKLTQEQVTAGDSIIAMNGLKHLLKSLGIR